MHYSWQGFDGGSAVDEAVAGSRAIGSHLDLVLHGGGNSSIKDQLTDVTGRQVEVIHVKGSGWDMATIEPAGFAPMRLARLRQLLELPQISDPQLVNELRCALVDSAAPDPSIESLLHALIPARAVLHSHADVVVAVTNQPDGAQQARSCFGPDVVVVPYVKPGFDLARLCREAWEREVTASTIGLVLLNHGLFTFGDTMEEAYRRHVALIDKAEAHLGSAPAPAPSPPATLTAPEPVDTATLRQAVSRVAGRPMVLTRGHDDRIAAFLGRPDLSSVATRGPATPDHVIRTKRLPLVGTDVEAYAADYQAYVDEHADRVDGELVALDPAPRIVLDPAHGVFTAGRTIKDARVVADIVVHTMDVIDAAERLGQYTPLPAAELFDVEYWDLEQAKLRRAAPPGPLTGQVALVTGAASGIGHRCAEQLLSMGAAVIGLDITPSVVDVFPGPAWLGVEADVTDETAVLEALARGVDTFGGLDVVVVAAGVFAASAPIGDLTEAAWRRTFAINVDAVLTLFGLVRPLLQLSPTDARVVVIGSKNVAAPGPGAAAYSASKAALTQLSRVAALEWAPHGIRVNVVHPDAVFDTGLWTSELLAERAAKYGMTVPEYTRRNLLSTTVSSNDVAALVGAMCTAPFASTTGAQVPVDGGNERVI